jgi:hypothetical protein
MTGVNMTNDLPELAESGLTVRSCGAANNENLACTSAQFELADQIKQLDEMQFIPTSLEASTSAQAVKLPLDLLASAGVAAGSLPEILRQVKQQIAVPGGNYLMAVDKLGNPIDVARLFKFNGEDAHLGSYLNDANQLQQARFKEVKGVVTQTPTLPCAPAVIAAAIALAQINQKLDAIQDSVNSVIEYLQIKDKASLRAGLETLRKTLADLSLNYGNSQFRQAKMVQVQSVNHESQQAIIELRAHVCKKLPKKHALELRDHTSKSAEDVIDLMREYQLALHVYAFSTLLDVVLVNNFKRDYLSNKIDDIRGKALDYRELYTQCFNALEQRNQRTVDSAAADVAARAIKVLGRAVAATPVGDHTQIDETLISTGSYLGEFNEGKNQDLKMSITEVREPGVELFAESLEAVSRVFDQHSTMVLTDDALLFLPHPQAA